MSIATRTIRKMFHLPTARPGARCLVPERLISQLIPGPGRITLITGASGGGKSRLLQEMKRRDAGAARWIDPRTIELPDQPVIDIAARAVPTAGGADAIAAALELLSRVGLAEAWTYLQKPARLSDGQRWRLILALAVAQAKNGKKHGHMQEAQQTDDSAATAIIAMDEFAALLDRVTAAVVARALRRLTDRSAVLGAVVVTSHDDLFAALRPDVHVVCDFGSVRIVHPPSAAAQNSQGRQRNNRQQNSCDNQVLLE
ncbi:MAG: hypothetical protein H7144_04565 [Burkholderiales bacterium]|nr:hypothetical protein [Phycisphaerae bacterium]